MTASDVAEGGSAGQALRFLLVGGANTVLTYLLLLALATVFDPRLAYTCAFLTGLVLSSAFTGRLVFRSRPGRLRRTGYGGWLLAVYAVGLVAVSVAERLNLAPLIVAAAPILVTAPLSFAGGRLLLAGRSTDQGSMSV